MFNLETDLYINIIPCIFLKICSYLLCAERLQSIMEPTVFKVRWLHHSSSIRTQGRTLIWPTLKLRIRKINPWNYQATTYSLEFTVGRQTMAGSAFSCWVNEISSNWISAQQEKRKIKRRKSASVLRGVLLKQNVTSYDSTLHDSEDIFSSQGN